MTEIEIDDLIKEAEEHIHFCRNINVHAYTSILIKKLLKVIEEQNALISDYENGTP